MLPAILAPTVVASDGPIPPTICRISRDLAHLAFWIPKADPPGLFIASVADADLSPKRLWSAENEHLSDLAWSPDGKFLAFTLSSGPPPGEPCIGVVKLSSQALSRLPGHAFAWAGNGATLIIADPPSARLYLRDLDLDVEHRISDIADDGDPHAQPVISVSPDQRRFALVTRRVFDDATAVHLAQHDGRQWRNEPLTQIPGTSLRILPFWSPDSEALALYVIDLANHHTTIIAAPHREGAGDILYSSDSVDGLITPAAHPDGRLIAFVRAHPVRGTSTLKENRLVLLDPVEHAVAPLTPDNQMLGNLRWLDSQTLLVEGGAAVWTIKLRASLEESPSQPERPEAQTANDGFIRTVITDPDPAFSFSCEIPRGWQRIGFPPEAIDFRNPGVMRPLCVFTPSYGALVFTVATRPSLPGMRPADALAFLARLQEFEVGPIEQIDLPCGPVAQALAMQRAGDQTLKMRLVMLEDGGRLFSITAMAPALLWDGVKATLDRIVETFTLLGPRGTTASPGE